jgi:hypothetical protein
MWEKVHTEKRACGCKIYTLMHDSFLSGKTEQKECKYHTELRKKREQEEALKNKLFNEEFKKFENDVKDMAVDLIPVYKVKSMHPELSEFLNGKDRLDAFKVCKIKNRYRICYNRVTEYIRRGLHRKRSLNLDKRNLRRYR